MPMLKKEFYRTATGPVANDEDWWRLVFDTDARRLYVEHEWAYVDVRKGGRGDDGKVEIEINEFLNKADWPAQRELLKLIRGLFESENNAK
jgi:hypothetical protein